MKNTIINYNNINNNTNINENNILPIELHYILIGIMLSDGGLYRSSPTANVRFEMSFGQKYKNYAEYLGELFKEYMNNPVKSIIIKGKEKNYENYRLKTKSLPIFNQYYEMFYKYDPELNKFIKRIFTWNLLEFVLFKS